MDWFVEDGIFPMGSRQVLVLEFAEKNSGHYLNDSMVRFAVSRIQLEVGEYRCVGVMEKYKTAVGNCNEGDGELFRGAGYIHLTGRGNYENFSEYIGDPEILEEGYRVVGGVYNRDISQIASKDVGVIDVGKYAWEASGWFWKIGNPKGIDLSTYADKRMWEETSKAINKRGDGLYERNRNMNDFYKILTNAELGLPEEKYE